MAKTKLAPPLAGIRGTVGGLTYSANGAGTYVKLWAPPSNPQSPLQMIERAYLAQMPELWRSLTGLQRTAWDTFAALPAQELIDSLAQSYWISGWLWFVKCNIRLLRVGRAPIVPPPVIPRPAAPTINDFRVAILGTETDLCVGGTPTASSSQPAHLPADAFDDLGVTWWASQPIGLPAWLEYQLVAPTAVREYALWIEVPAYGGNPTDWTFQAWNGGGWDTLDTQAAVAMPTQAWYSYKFPNETSYDRYRIHVTQIKTPATNYALVFEMAFFPGILGRSAITYPDDTFSVYAPDLILHIAMATSQARAVQYPGYYEVLAMQSPGSFSQEFQPEITSVFGTILPGRRWFARFHIQTPEGVRSAPATTAVNTIE